MPEDNSNVPEPLDHKRQSASFILPTTRQDDEPEVKTKPKTKLEDAKKAGLLPRLVLIALVLISFFPLFGNDVLWSKYDSVVRSPFQEMENWTDLFKPESIRHDDTLTITSYFLENAVPLDPAITHRAINLLLHLIAVFFLLRFLELFKFSGAFATAFVFSLHPVVVQTIYWPGYRGQIIGLILLLAALFYGIRNRDSSDFAKCIILTALTSLTHIAGIAIPFIVALSIVYQSRTLHLNSFNRALPLLCIATFIIVWTKTGISEPATLGDESTDILYSLNQAGESMFFYMQQAVIPLELSLFYPFNDENKYLAGAELSLLPFFLFIPFYILIAINHRKRWSKAILLGLTACLLLIIPETYPIGAMIDGKPALEDHGNYIGLPFILALIIIGGVGAMRTVGSLGETLSKVALTLLIIFEILITASFAYVVGNPTRLWESLTTQWPESVPAKIAYLDSVKTSEGYALDDETLIRLLINLVEERPEEQNLQIELARAYVRLEQVENATRVYRRLLGDSNPGNDLLEEAASFFDQAGLRWEARSARQRKK